MTPKTGILLVPCESSLLNGVRTWSSVRRGAWEIVDGTPASPLQKSGSPRPDLVIADRQTAPSFWRLLRTIRSRWRSIPVLAVNAYDNDDCIRLLDEGCDDACLGDHRTILARANAIVRRVERENADLRIAFGDIVVDRERRRVWCGGRLVVLSGREHDLLVYLLAAAPEPASKVALCMHLWGSVDCARKNTVEVHTGALRRKLSSSATVRIVTVRGVGYAMR